MIDGGNVTIFVSDFEETLRFYTDVLGFPLKMRAENFWAEVVAGQNLVIGIHPRSDHAAPPGTEGSMQIGLNVVGSLPEFMESLRKRGVTFDGPMIDDPMSGNRFANFRDPDGNRLYLWESVPAHTST